MRDRSTIDWGPDDQPLCDDLDRFRARARGRRLKQLALLGLRAEALGLRLDANGTGVAGLPVAALHLPQLETTPVEAVVPDTAPPSLTPGQGRLIDNYGY